METMTINITYDEMEDIRFALAFVANIDEEKADSCKDTVRENALREQAERFRCLAKKVSTY